MIDTPFAVPGSASNLVPGDTNGHRDAFVDDRSTGRTKRVNVDSAGRQDYDDCINTSIAADGRAVAFDSTDSSLVAGDTNGTTLRTAWGGDLLVVPLVTQLVGLSPGGASLFGDVPDDESLGGRSVVLQVLEADPGAAKGVSFTPGLEMVPGR